MIDIKRSCGDCHACCELLSIDDEDSNFHKKAVVPCENLKEGKCGIYETKPKVCTGFYCMWMIDRIPGMFTELDHPSRSGIIIVMNDPNSNFTKYSKVVSFTAYETKPGSFKSYWGDKLLKRVAKKWLLLLMPWEARESEYKIGPSTKFIGPYHEMNMVVNFDKYERKMKNGKNG